MKNRVARWVTIAVLVTTAAEHGWTLHGAEKSGPISPALAAAEREGCIQNLKVIYAAIQAYQKDHKDLPNWFSDLVPQYLPDANVLICPLCRRTGQIEASNLADPRISSSYLFEFCPLPLGAAATNAPTRTRREWKRRQMGLVGSIVPVVRCRNHNPVLNLAFDGRIYDSPPQWEQVVTNLANPDDLTPPRMFADEPRAAAPGAPKPPPPRYPARDPKTPKELIDLSPHYNASLPSSWHGGTGNDLAGLPVGIQKLGGIDFDVRGIVQLGGKGPSAEKFPAQVTGIKVAQKCQRLQFLHSAAFGLIPDEGKIIGTYVIHYAANQMRLEVPIHYGHDLRNWHSIEGEPALGQLKVAWQGENEVTKRHKTSLRLFLTTWTNLVPAIEIESIDIVSKMGTATPFVIAVTAE